VKIVSGWVAAIAAMLIASPVSGADEPAAIVASVSGHVDVIAEGSIVPTHATFGRPLARGERIVVAPGGRVTLLLRDGSVVELHQRDAMTIGGSDTARAHSGGARIPNEIAAGFRRFVAGGSRDSGLVALSTLRQGGDERPLLVRPRLTNIRDAQPWFEWRPVPGATRYRVSVTGERGELWHRDVSDTLLEYPTDAPPLAWETDFVWEVAAFSARRELRREASSAHVVTAAEAARVADALARIRSATVGSDSLSALYLAGGYLFGEGLYAEAGERFEVMRRLVPDSPGPHEALSDVFRAVGLMDLAVEEHCEALAHSR
jgi:hypothetical protein